MALVITNGTIGTKLHKIKIGITKTNTKILQQINALAVIPLIYKYFTNNVTKLTMLLLLYLHIDFIVNQHCCSCNCCCCCYSQSSVGCKKLIPSYFTYAKIDLLGSGRKTELLSFDWEMIPQIPKFQNTASLIKSSHFYVRK